MYMILVWMNEDYLSHISNINGSIMLFKSIKDADNYIETRPYLSDTSRVISIEGVQ